MAGVFSTRFLVATAAGSWTYQVPAGKRAVVKGLSVLNGDQLGGAMSLWIGTTPVFLVNIATNTGINQGGLHLVVNAGETLKMVTSANVTGQVSGYLLEATG